MEQAPRVTQTFGWREINPPVGCCKPGRRQSHSLRQQPHPARFVAGAGNLWRASTHKGSPMFRRRAPARSTLGQGASSRLARRQGVRKPLMTEARHTDQGNGGGRDSWSNDLLAPSPDGGQTGRAHRCRRRRALWSPARCGTFASPPVKWPARQGESEDQDALEAARRLRGALRRPVGDSIGNVPLQSG